MLIDWFTIIAQIINFLVLVALLKYFLYGRILQAMDRRRMKSPPGWRKLKNGNGRQGMYWRTIRQSSRTWKTSGPDS